MRMRRRFLGKFGSLRCQQKSWLFHENFCLIEFHPIGTFKIEMFYLRIPLLGVSCVGLNKKLPIISLFIVIR